MVLSRCLGVWGPSAEVYPIVCFDVPPVALVNNRPRAGGHRRVGPSIALIRFSTLIVYPTDFRVAIAEGRDAARTRKIWDGGHAAKSVQEVCQCTFDSNRTSLTSNEESR